MRKTTWLVVTMWSTVIYNYNKTMAISMFKKEAWNAIHDCPLLNRPHCPYVPMPSLTLHNPNMWPRYSNILEFVRIYLCTKIPSLSRKHTNMIQYFICWNRMVHIIQSFDNDFNKRLKTMWACQLRAYWPLALDTGARNQMVCTSIAHTTSIEWRTPKINK